MAKKISQKQMNKWAKANAKFRHLKEFSANEHKNWMSEHPEYAESRLKMQQEMHDLNSTYESARCAAGAVRNAMLYGLAMHKLFF